MSHRPAALAVAAITLIGVAACSHDSDDAGAFVTPAPAASSAAAAPAATTSAPAPRNGQAPVGKDAGTDVVSAAGLGPYRTGTAQRDLSSAKLIGSVKKVDTCTAAAGLSKYKTPSLAFSNGKLTRIAITSSKVQTPAGAKVGMAYDDVKKLYPAGKQLDNWVGASAWYTTDGGNALLFKISDGKVSEIDAGAGEAVQFAYTDQQNC
ncbi:hypothetical protein [Actinoplanes sp. N902-109]|uniref:hypothetical protein n=1 Tax=Actinoplanes sp. (strain N902-109) TaxID=649831 RepID=UPI0003293E16|nr:hypothetical protein [Actinoplanes sp. N902-109]AGL21304.1 hypothetical protein L083_7794 [Actinoplanes sp. N902-109]